MKNNFHLPIIDHLDSLRSCLIWAIVTVMIGSVLSFFILDHILRLLFIPLANYGKESVHFFSPYEAFFLHIKVALFSGVVFGMPMILIQVWRFVAPALLETEKKMVIIASILSSLLFAAGIIFAYHMVLPYSLKFFLSFETEFFQAVLSAQKYINFVIMFLLSFGLMFLLPIVLFCMYRLGIMTPEILKQKRKLAFVFILVTSAILTPPDVVTQLMLSGPIYVLYELSILLIMIDRRFLR
jgi:sec-independent protein translocase protein TatC